MKENAPRPTERTHRPDFVPFVDEFGKQVGFWVDYPRNAKPEEVNKALNKRFPEGTMRPVYETVTLTRGDVYGFTHAKDDTVIFTPHDPRKRGRPPRIHP